MIPKNKIEDAINFSSITDLINNYIDEHSEEIVHATMDSIARKLELSSGYKFY